MGLLRSKGDKLAADALDAQSTGRTVFVCKVTVAADPTSGGIGAWTDAVQDVEHLGWRLDQMSLTEAKGWLTAVLLFRR